jgi:hypothetical protein
MTFVASCPKCHGSLPGELCNTTELVRCTACEAAILIEVFPAAFQAQTAGAIAEPVVEEGVASCFYHQQKKAVTHCDACGRFLCALCDVDFGGQHLCPGCLQTGRKKGKIAGLDTSRTLWDSAALLLCLVPTVIFVLWPVFIVTAPLAMVLAVVSYYKPGSLVPRRRWRPVVVIVLSLLQLLFWVWFGFFREG